MFVQISNTLARAMDVLCGRNKLQLKYCFVVVNDNNNIKEKYE